VAPGFGWDCCQNGIVARRLGKHKSTDLLGPVGGSRPVLNMGGFLPWSCPGLRIGGTGPGGSIGYGPQLPEWSGPEIRRGPRGEVLGIRSGKRYGGGGVGKSSLSFEESGYTSLGQRTRGL